MICRTLRNVCCGNNSCRLEETCSRVVAICKWHSPRDAICAHSLIIKLGLDQNLYLHNNLLSLYARRNELEQAHHLFDEMPQRDVVSWTALIAGHGRRGNHEKSMELFGLMIGSAVSPNEFTLSTVLRSCSALEEINSATCIHAHVLKQGFDSNLVVQSTLVDLYSKHGHSEEGVKLFEEIGNGDTISWTSVISSLVEDGNSGQALEMYPRMIESGVAPNEFTFVKLLSASSNVGFNGGLSYGMMLHGQLIRRGMEMNLILKTTLVNLYLRNRAIEKSIRILRSTPEYDALLWTSVVSGLVDCGFLIESFQAFSEMISSGVEPNRYTLSSLVRVCGTAQSPGPTKQLHGYIVKTRSDYDVIVGNALVDSYAGLNRFGHARFVIREMNRRDAATYTSLATKLNRVGHHESALGLITVMEIDGVKMDEFSLACFLSAAAGSNQIEPGRQLHCFSVKSGLKTWISVSNGLVDLYGKCKSIRDAVRAFEDIPEPNLVSWNALILQFASNRFVSPALSAYEDMKMAGFEPDGFTLLAVLVACSHGGLADLALEYFWTVPEAHSVEPRLNHYTCLVEILGRARRLEEARDIIGTMSVGPDATIYKKLLAACGVHKNVHLGEEMARKGLELDPSDTEFFELLANLYDSSGLDELGDKARDAMRISPARKKSSSGGDLHGEENLFVMGK